MEHIFPNAGGAGDFSVLIWSLVWQSCALFPRLCENPSGMKLNMMFYRENEP
nr:hypothetical protein [uncultured Cohaesibacter sp.]